jgi:integrase
LQAYPKETAKQVINLQYPATLTDITRGAPSGVNMSFCAQYWRLAETGIYKHREKPKCWHVVARLPKSTAKKEAVVYGTIEQARAKRGELMAALSRRSLTRPKEFKHIWKALGFYIHRHYSKKSQYRIGSGKSIMRYWIGRIGELAPWELEAPQINMAIREMQEAGYKISGIIPYVSRLRTALDYAKSEGKIRYNSDVWNQVIKLEAQATKKLIFDESALEPYLKAMPDYAVRVLRYKVAVPCRLLELYAALTEDVDLEKRYFVIRKDKNGNERKLPIPSHFLPEFEAVVASGSKWVFPRPEKRANGTVEYYPLSRCHLTTLWARIAKSIGTDRKIKLRMLRHLAISQWLKDIDEATVGETAGATPETMQTYYNMVPVESLVSAADKMAEKMGRLGDASGKLLAFRQRKEGASG